MSGLLPPDDEDAAKCVQSVLQFYIAFNISHYIYVVLVMR